MLPFGMLRADRQGLYQDVLKKHWRDFLKKSVVAWLNFQMQSAIPMTTHTCARAIFFYVVGRDNCAFHAPRGLAVNQVSARLDEVTAQRLLPQAIYLKACFEGPGQHGRFSECFPKMLL